MSEQTVELLRNAFPGAFAQDLEEVARAYWHPDIVYIEDPRWPDASRYEGRDAVLRCFQAYKEALAPDEDLAVTLERIDDVGERQVLFVRFEGRSASGLPHDHLWGYLAQVTDGHIVYLRAYYQPEEALEAAGLPT